jgi:glycosyltransferase involved in cell wall biosynthesis
MPAVIDTIANEGPQTGTNMASSAPLPRVTILLATYNGAAHLQAQLMSYCAQHGVLWDLWVSDDGSSDGTRAIIEAFRAEHGIDHGGAHDIRVLDGPRMGPAANFMSLLTHPDLPTDRPVALSDQDDVWLPGKLSRALAALRETGPVTLYSGQSYHTDAALNVIGRSRRPPRAPSFHNAVTQNIVSGHSIVMDPGALALVRKAGIPQGIPYHDWWLYLLISGAGGNVYVDRARMIQYRQHMGNAMGAHHGIRSTLYRVGQVLGHTYSDWVSANVTALTKVMPLLTPDHQAVLTALKTEKSGPAHALALWRLGLYRQTRLASACFYLAAALGRV